MHVNNHISEPYCRLTKRAVVVVGVFYVVNTVLWCLLAVWLFGVDPGMVALTAAIWPVIVVDGGSQFQFEIAFALFGIFVALYVDYR